MRQARNHYGAHGKPKHCDISKVQGVKTEKTILFILRAERNSDPTPFSNLYVPVTLI
jgi:hypothetical protein